MVIRELLSRYKDEEDKFYILSKVLNKDLTYIYTNLDKDLEDKDVNLYTKYMEEIKSGSPLAYVIGETNFYGLDYFVDRGVLIPRNDTENLVRLALELLNEEKSYDILELGTGTGIIANTIGYKRPKAKILAVDISDKALVNSEKNRRRYDLENVKFKKSDLFEEVTGRFDMIISNPPYIKSSIIKELDENVRDYEPHLALDGGRDGLDYYRNIIRQGYKYLKENAYIVLEIGYDQREEVLDLFYKYGYRANSIKDLAGRDRVVYGQLGG